MCLKRGEKQTMEICKPKYRLKPSHFMMPSKSPCRKETDHAEKACKTFR